MAYFSVSNPSTNILPPITPAVLKKAIELIDIGASIRQAADILGVPPSQLRSKLPSKEEKSLKERALDSIVAVQGRICSTVEDGNKTTRKGFAGASTCTESTLKVVNKLIPGICFYIQLAGLLFVEQEMISQLRMMLPMSFLKPPPLQLLIKLPRQLSLKNLLMKEMIPRKSIIRNHIGIVLLIAF